MKVLYFFASGFDTPNPSYHLMESMVEDTLKAGIDVHMISSHMTGLNEDIPKYLLDYSNFKYDIVKRGNIKKNSFVKRYLDGIKYAWDCSKVIKKTSDYDLIYVQSCPTALYNVLVSKIFGKKKPIIYSIQDMFPGSSIHSGVMNNKLLQIIFYSLQKIAYKNADYINVISEDMKQKVIVQGVSQNKINVVVDWCDNTVIKEIEWEKNKFVEKYQLSKDKFYVQYAGTMGFVFDYKMVLKVAEILKGYNNIEFQMIGQGSQKELFIEECKKLNLNNVVFYPLEPLEMVPHVYSASTVELIPLKKGIIGNSVPSKASQLMACNRPVINSVDKDSTYYRMFNENQMGISASNEDPNSVAEAIIELYNDSSKRQLYAENGKKYGAIHYSRKNNTDKLINQIKSVIQEHSKKRKEVF